MSTRERKRERERERERKRERKKKKTKKTILTPQKKKPIKIKHGYSKIQKNKINK